MDELGERARVVNGVESGEVGLGTDMVASYVLLGGSETRIQGLALEVDLGPKTLDARQDRVPATWAGRGLRNYRKLVVIHLLPPVSLY